MPKPDRSTYTGGDSAGTMTPLRTPQQAGRLAPVGALFAFSMLIGCAGVSHRPVKDNDSETGFRYYNSSPYILVQTNNEGGLSSEFTYLPDLDQMWRAKRFAFLSKLKTSLTLENGVLTDSEANADATEVPKAVIGALEKIAVKAATGGQFSAKGGREDGVDTTQPEFAPSVFLFKVVKNADGEWGLVGASAPGPVRYQSSQ